MRGGFWQRSDRYDAYRSNTQVWWIEWKEAKVKACKKYLLKENLKENHSTELAEIPYAKTFWNTVT